MKNFVNELQAANSRDVVVLLVGEDRYTMSVSKKALGATSRVFSAMFTRSFLESTARTVPLPDDEVEGLTMLFCAAHYRLHEIPQPTTLSDIMSLARMSDKYDCSQVVALFFSGYHERLAKKAKQWYARMWLLWATKDMDEVEKGVLFKAEQSSKKQLPAAESLPLDFAETIHRVRNQELEYLIKGMYDLWEKAQEGTVCESCRKTSRYPICEYVFRGQLAATFQALGWSLSEAFMPEPDNIISSVREVTEIMKRCNLTEDQSETVCDHYGQDVYELISESRPSKVLDKSQLGYFR